MAHGMQGVVVAVAVRTISFFIICVYPLFLSLDSAKVVKLVLICKKNEKKV